MNQEQERKIIDIITENTLPTFKTQDDLTAIMGSRVNVEKKKYRKSALEFHPDKCRNSKEYCTAMFIKISDEWEKAQKLDDPEISEHFQEVLHKVVDLQNSYHFDSNKVGMEYLIAQHALARQGIHGDVGVAGELPQAEETDSTAE